MDRILECFDVKETYTRKHGLETEWEKIGTMYLHKDGKGYTQHLTRLPRSKRVVCRPPLQNAAAALPPPAQQEAPKMPDPVVVPRARADRYAVLREEGA